MPSPTPVLVALVAGGWAGLSVDLVLFPLDTVKTRLQSSRGFLGSGGFRGIYSGVGSTAVGSMPGAALFFCTYEQVKHYTSSWPSGLSHMAAASAGEPVACLVRVPTEVVKQRAQTNRIASWKVLRQTLFTEGFMGLYRGYWSTVGREIPFALIQFPIWEMFKRKVGERQEKPVAPWQSSLCGALAGGIASALTTPLDVAKTRIMLAPKDSHLASGNIHYALKTVWRERGIAGMFAGVLPRVLWISLGGAVFLGVYEKCRQLALVLQNSLTTT